MHGKSGCFSPAGGKRAAIARRYPAPLSPFLSSPCPARESNPGSSDLNSYSLTTELIIIIIIVVIIIIIIIIIITVIVVIVIIVIN